MFISDGDDVSSGSGGGDLPTYAVFITSTSPLSSKPASASATTSYRLMPPRIVLYFQYTTHRCADVRLHVAVGG